MKRQRVGQNNQGWMSSRVTSRSIESINFRSAVNYLLIGTIFFSSFLLFQVQPIISKIILPWFGGSPAVWTTSMFFFQLMLLGGYCYAYGLNRFLPLKAQFGLHVVICIAAVLLLPIYPSDSWKTAAVDSQPAWSVIQLLGQSVGIQFFLLSTTAPLTQVWWHRITRESPYWLYAVSNAGSLIALVSYPVLVEPSLGMRWQAFVWACVFAGTSGLISLCLYFSTRGHNQRDAISDHKDNEKKKDAVPAGGTTSWKESAIWVLLSSCGSILLIAMTNHFSQNIAVVPFLWVMPLAVYLLSFILTFSRSSVYHRTPFGLAMMGFMSFCSVLYARDDLIDSVPLLLFIHLVALFFGCMICHGELFRMRPASRHITSFYLAISLGGALGGLFVSFIAPQIFLQYYEYPFVLTSCCLIFVVAAIRDRESALYGGKPIVAWAFIILLLLFFTYQIQRGVKIHSSDALLLRRNFYGVLSVDALSPEQDPKLESRALVLMNGTIKHGMQYLDPKKSDQPTEYYSRDTGLGMTMDYFSKREGKRVGMLGLGVGTIAAYSSKGDVFKAYEINPDVIQLATTPEIFSYWDLLRKRKASGLIVEGDARINLEKDIREGNPQEFDILVVDVFSGDAIPVHLLTSQAFDVYLKHLAEGGVIAIHITNRHLDLMPVIRDLAMSNKMKWLLTRNSRYSDWVLVAKSVTLGDMVDKVGKNYKFVPVEPNQGVVHWTDDYSNLFKVLKF